jgi:hypothetical protein
MDESAIPNKTESTFKVIVIVLLAALLVVSVVFTAWTIVRTARQDKLCSDTLALADTMLLDYEQAVYEDDRVDTIQKQTFLASEFQFMAQQILLQLVASCRP